MRILLFSLSAFLFTASPGAVPDWIKPLQKERPITKQVALPGAEMWVEKRGGIELKWRRFLGALPKPHCDLAPQVLEKTTLGRGVTRTKLRLQVEPGVWMPCYLFTPPGDGPFPACVCLHSTTKETILQPAGLGAQPEKAFALDLVKRGYMTIAPENFLWNYPAAENEKSIYHARTRTFLEKYPGVKGMAKMIHDASRCVDYLETLPTVKKNAIGTIGHSLGAKEVTYLMAFDKRVACVSSEGGVAFEFTNYHDPWYLGGDIRTDGFNCHANEVVALIAPRPWLLIGGNSADGEKSWPIVKSVLPVYRLLGKPGACGLFVHEKGHAMPPEARQIAFRWLDYHLKK